MDERRQVQVQSQYRWCYNKCKNSTWHKQETPGGPWICTCCKKPDKKGPK